MAHAFRAGWRGREQQPTGDQRLADGAEALVPRGGGGPDPVGLGRTLVQRHHQRQRGLDVLIREPAAQVRQPLRRARLLAAAILFHSVMPERGS